jgi:hypothetical protein
MFTQEGEEMEVIDHDVVTALGKPASLMGETRLSTWEPYFVRKEITVYRCHYKCPNCGHEWYRTKTEEKQL